MMWIYTIYNRKKIITDNNIIPNIPIYTNDIRHYNITGFLYANIRRYKNILI